MLLYYRHFEFRLKLLFRDPEFWLPLVVLPSLLFPLFAVVFARDAGQDAIMASFALYAAVGVCIYLLGVGVARERDATFQAWIQTLPHSLWPARTARLTAVAVIMFTASSLVVVLALLLGLTDAGAGGIAALFGVIAIAAAPSSLLGVALGYLAAARTATASATLIHLSLSYLGGLWAPPHALPDVIRAVSSCTPYWHARELAWRAVAGEAMPAENLVWLAGFTLLFGAIAYLAARRDAGRRSG